MIRKGLLLLLLFTLLTGCTPAAKRSRVRDRADRYFKAGEYEKAKVEYLNLLRLNDQSPWPFQQIGFIWIEQGAPLRAIPFLLRVRELAPTNVAARTKLAAAFMTVGGRANALKEAAEVLQQDPSNSAALVVLADASQSKEEIAAAQEQLKKFPNKNAEFYLASASLSTRTGHLGAAAANIQQAISLEPKLARAHLALGYLYLIRGNSQRAAEELKTASDLGSPRSEDRIKYAEFKAANGAAPEAKTLLQTITKEAPDYLPAWRDLAQIAVTEGKYDEALSLLDNLFNRNPEDPDAQLLKAQILLAKGEPTKAMEIADRINTNFPGNPLVKYTLARTYLAANNPAQAQAALEQAIALKPDYTDAITALADLDLRLGNPQDAIRILEDLVIKHPELQQARAQLGNAYLAAGRLDAAAATFHQQITMTPESPDAYLAYGSVLRRQNKNEEARHAFEKASELSPDNLTAVDQLLEMDLADKRYDAATQRVEDQVKKHPNTAGTYYLEGKVYFAHGAQRDAPRAEAALQKAVQLNPNFVPAYETLISLYIAENKLPEAITELETRAAKTPSDYGPHLMMGLVYEQMKNYPRASDSYSKVLSLNPNSVLALNNLAYLDAEKLNKLDEGYELAQKAHNLEPNNGRVGDTLAWILYRRKDYQQALALENEAASKFPDNPEIQFHLGMISYMMGQSDMARAAFEKAAHSATDFPNKDEAQRRLIALQSAEGGKTQLSIPELEASAKQQPNDVVLLQRLAEAYEHQGQNENAAATYKQILKLNPKLSGTALKLAQLYSGPLGNTTEAVGFAKKARDLSPNDPQASAAIGHIALQTGNYEWAYSLLQESSRKLSNDPACLRDFGLAAYAMGKVPQAREAMQKCLDATPTEAQAKEAKQFLAMIPLEQPSPDVLAAESQVDSALSVGADYVPALMAKAAIQLQRNDNKGAAETYARVLQKYSDFAPAQKRLAAIYADDPSTLSRAYDLAIKARKSLPEDPELARTLAEISFKRNEFSYAAQLFRESGSKRPLSPTDRYYFGIAQLQSRQEAEGRKNLEQALSAGLPEPFAAEAKKRLAAASGAQ
jgi:tetratricopeptide (TPR) repeat protein